MSEKKEKELRSIKITKNMTSEEFEKRKKFLFDEDDVERFFEETTQQLKDTQNYLWTKHLSLYDAEQDFEILVLKDTIKNLEDKLKWVENLHEFQIAMVKKEYFADLARIILKK